LLLVVDRFSFAVVMELPLLDAHAEYREMRQPQKNGGPADEAEALLQDLTLNPTTGSNLHVAAYQFRLLLLVIISACVMAPWCHTLHLPWIIAPALFILASFSFLLYYQCACLPIDSASLPFGSRLRLSVQYLCGIQPAVALGELPVWFGECLLHGYLYVFLVSVWCYLRLRVLEADDPNLSLYTLTSQSLLYRYALLAIVTALMLLVVIEHPHRAERNDSDDRSSADASERLLSRQVNLSITRAQALAMMGRWSAGEGASVHRIDPDTFFQRVSAIISVHEDHLRPALYASPPVWTWQKALLVVLAFLITWLFGNFGLLGESADTEWHAQLLVTAGRLSLVFFLAPLLFALRVPTACYRHNQLLMRYCGQMVSRLSSVEDVLVWVSIRQHYLSHIMPLQYERAQYCFAGSFLLILLSVVFSVVSVIVTGTPVGRDAFTFTVAIFAGANVWLMLSRAIEIQVEQHAHTKLLHYRCVSLKAQAQHAKQMSVEAGSVKAPVEEKSASTDFTRASAAAPSVMIHISPIQSTLHELESCLSLLDRIIPLIPAFDEEPQALGVHLTRTFRTVLLGYLTTAVIAIMTKLLLDLF
jgi:hypothetical protein